MKKNKIIPACLVAALATLVCFSACKKEETKKCGQEAVPACCSSSKCDASRGAGEKLLSHHDTKAVFKGLQQRRCRGMTALCPDKCGDSGTIAVFDIAGYNDYQKPDHYGDDPAEQYVFMLESTTGASDVCPETLELVKNLRPGDEVNLVWDHVYVSDGKANYPKRVVRKIAPLGTCSATKSETCGSASRSDCCDSGLHD